MSSVFLDDGHDLEIINTIDGLVINLSDNRIMRDGTWKLYTTSEAILYEMLSKSRNSDLIYNIVTKLIQEIDEEYCNDNNIS